MNTNLTKRILAGVFSLVVVFSGISTGIVVSADEVEFSHVEHFWYDEHGVLIDNPDIISNLENAQPKKSRGEICCSLETMNKTTYYNEEHTYIDPLPAQCVYDRFKIVYCTYCGTEWSRTNLGQYTHIHYN